MLPRELQVLVGVQNGLSNRQIGASITLAEDTVKYHLKRIFTKLGVSRRSEAVAVYNGLLLVMAAKAGEAAYAAAASIDTRLNSGESESRPDC